MSDHTSPSNAAKPANRADFSAVPAMERLIKARSNMILTHPFYGAMALSLLLESRPDVGTAATDGKRIYYAPDFVAKLNDAELRGLVAHEVLHVAFQHHTRRGTRDPELWNQAADFVINLILKDAGFRLPDGALLDEKFRDMCTEDVYRELKKNPPPKGKGGAADFGKVIDACDPRDAAGMAKAEMDTELTVRKAMVAARAMGKRAGTVPAALERLIGALDHRPQNWREILREFWDSRMIADSTWSLPNRRFLGAGFIMPGTVPAALGHAVIAIDTSGSISQQALGLFENEARAMLEEGGIERVTVLYCDTRIQCIENFEGAEGFKLNACGGGGTSFVPVMNWVAENAPDACALVYFTDMECFGSWGDDPKVPVLWASYGSGRVEAPFGRVVTIDEDAV